MPYGSVYGVSRAELAKFVSDNRCVADWLGKFTGRTVGNYANVLCRFFKWLRIVKGIDILPLRLLNERLKASNGDDIEARRRHVTLALEFSRDNPDFKEFGSRWRYQIFMVIKSFFDYHEVPLTSARGIFGVHKGRKNHPKQIALAQAKHIISNVSQALRTILIVMLQSGMSVGDVLNRFSPQYEYVKSQIEEGRERIRIDIQGRKTNTKPYFTYISRDAVQELRKWFIEREAILIKAKKTSNLVFVTERGEPYSLNAFEQNMIYYLTRLKLRNGPYQVSSHMFRKLFKTEASIPERGVDRSVVEFWMGHVEGLNDVGGVYDRTPEIHEDVIEREYQKIEPYLNIFTGVLHEEPKPKSTRELALERLGEWLERDPRRIEKLIKTIEET